MNFTVDGKDHWVPKSFNEMDEADPLNNKIMDFILNCGFILVCLNIQELYCDNLENKDSIELLFLIFFMNNMGALI